MKKKSKLKERLESQAKKFADVFNSETSMVKLDCEVKKVSKSTMFVSFSIRIELDDPYLNGVLCNFSDKYRTTMETLALTLFNKPLHFNNTGSHSFISIKLKAKKTKRRKK